MDYQTLIQVFAATIRIATPLLLACLAGLYSERSGIFDIGLEGKMLIGAFTAAAIASLSGSAWLGLGAAIIASCLFALLHGLASITLRGNQLISGVAINSLALGLSYLIALNVFHSGGSTPPLSGKARFTPLFQSDGLIGTVFLSHNILVYLAFAVVPLTWWVLYRTRYGLRLRAVGENPAAVDTAGISVTKLRYSAVLITGILCGAAGAYLSTGQAAGFTNAMTADRGFIALAALIFAKWRPVPALGACLLFGFVEALGYQAQGNLNFDSRALNTLVDFVEAGLPYILTVIILAGFVGRAVPPKAGGIPYVKER